MSGSIFPLTPVGKTRFRTAEGAEFDVFDPETDDAEMKRVRDLILERCDAAAALEWVVANQAKVVKINGQHLWELYLPGRGLPSGIGNSRDEAIQNAIKAAAGGGR